MTDLKTHQSKGIVRRLSIAVISSIALSLGSCATNTPSSSESPQSDASPVATADELQVMTTFLPITQFTKAVVGDRAEVTQLLPTNVGSHDYQAKPEDAQRLANLHEAWIKVSETLELEAYYRNHAPVDEDSAEFFFPE